jgi:peptidoglycan-associated lipoprotein
VRDDQQVALANERAQRIATDSSLAQELGVTRADLQALRTDLQSMRSDFGAKIAAVESGMQFMMPVNFAFDDAAVRDTDHVVLDRFAKVVQKYYPTSKVTIEGFADPAGGDRYNVALSSRRADAVKQYLVSQGLTDAQLATIGYGKTRLVAPGASRDQPGAELNRRVVFVIETKSEQSVATTGQNGAVGLGQDDR